MLVTRNNWLCLIGVSVCFFTIVSIVTFAASEHEANPIPRLLTGIKGGSPSQVNSNNILNRTLGFQEVFAIGLPGRTDKRDLLSVAASVTGFDLTWLPGITYDEVDPKAIPEGWKHPYFPGATKEEAAFVGSWIGSWRAHMNVLLHIVENNIQTALILEDDCDWDVTLKQQLSHFANGGKAIQEATNTNTSTSISPYGDQWDVLWLGHRRVGPDNANQPVYVMSNDTTVPDIKLRHTLWRQSHIPDEMTAPDTRVIIRTKYSTGTFAYAVTLSSARKLLASLADNNIVFDVALSNMCKEAHVSPFFCYAPYPPILSSHRMAGSANRDSDIDSPVTAAKTHDEYTWDILYSTMLNIKALVAGQTLVQSQWPESSKPTRDIDEPLDVHGELRWMNFGTMQEKWHPKINGVKPEQSALKRKGRSRVR